MSYRVFILPSAQKEVEHLPREDYERVGDVMLALAENPRPSGCTKLSKREGWSIRQGDSALSTGVRVLPGSGTWASVSDRNAKTNFAFTNERDILTSLSTIPIETWNYKTQDPSIRHIGPMAQDFYAAFSVGEDDKHITTIDADGVALAAIQGLYQVVQDELKARDAKIASQQKQIDSLEARLAALEQASGTNARTPSTDWNSALAFAIGAIGVVAIERARKGAQ